MNVLLAISSLNVGGAETHLVGLAAALARRGNRVTVVSAGGSLVGELTRQGIPHVTLPLDCRRLWSLWRARVGLRRLLRHGGFDVIHAHARIPAFLLWGLSRECGIPMITTVHARFSSEPPWRLLSRWGDRCIAVSEDLRQYLAEEYGVSPLRVSVIPNGVDTERFCPSRSLTDRVEAGEDALSPSEVSPFRVLFVSRLDQDCSDGAYALCRLAPRLARVIDGLEVVIGGGGEALSSIRRMAQRVNEAAGRRLIRVMGRVGRPEALYREASLTVGVSRVALEAAATGVPVILGGNEGYLGALTPKRFSVAEATNFCCRGMREMTDSALYADLVRAARKTPRERLEWGAALRTLVCERQEQARVAVRTEEVYGQAVREKRGYREGQGGEVVLCGYYGFGNLGDDALLRSAIRLAKKRYPAWRISALTRNGRADEPAFGVRCVSRRNPAALLREIAGARLFVFGGGTLLQDQSSLRSLVFYTGLLRYAAARGVPCELWGNGLGPLSGTVGRRLTAGALRGCATVCCRDVHSAELARELLGRGERGRVHLTADLAESLAPAEEERRRFLLSRLFGCGQPPDFAVVALRGKAGRGYMRSCAEWLSVLRGQGVELVFVNMFPKEDGAVTARFCGALGGRMLSGVSESDLVGVMRHCRVVCGMRLHALVMAYAAGAPFVGFGGEEKVRAFCREKGGVYFTDLYR